MADQIDYVSPGFTILVGRPGSGKSYLLKYLMLLGHPDYNKDPYLYGIVFTTTRFNKDWSSIIPEEYVHPRYDPAIMEALMDIRKEHNTGRVFLILDDCLDQAAFRSQLFLDLCTCFRHYRIDIFISTQYIYKCAPVIRECATRVALFRTVSDRSLKACFESFGAFFRNFEEFKKFIIDNTDSHKFIWYIANSSQEKVEDIYKVLKCPDKVPEIKFEY